MYNRRGEEEEETTPDLETKKPSRKLTDQIKQDNEENAKTKANKFSGVVASISGVVVTGKCIPIFVLLL
jgi:hypothetical protein